MAGYYSANTNQITCFVMAPKTGFGFARLRVHIYNVGIFKIGRKFRKNVHQFRENVQ